MPLELTETGAADQEYFEIQYVDRGSGCTCFRNPPCGYCTHPGNPLNLENDPSAWEWVVDGKSAAWQPWHDAPWFKEWLDLCYRPYTHRNDHLNHLKN